MRKVLYNMLKLSHILSVLNWHLQHPNNRLIYSGKIDVKRKKIFTVQSMV